MVQATNSYFAMVDIGGTSVKSALVSSECEVVENSYSITPIDENGSAEHIIRTITSVLKEKLSILSALPVHCNSPNKLDGIGLCFPGPFDYQQGISLMKHKFSSIYGVNLRNPIINRLGLTQDSRVVFNEDSIAFLKGETWIGNAMGFSRVIGLTLGTGLGVAFMVNGKIIRHSPDTPPSGELWCFPVNEGVMEDKISRRGIARIYQSMTGEFYDDVKAIAQSAKHGDADSLRTMAEFGRVMGRLLRPHIERFAAECIVVGGQIAKSFKLFEPSLREELSGLPLLEKITRAKFIRFSPFFGLLFEMKEGDIDC